MEDNLLGDAYNVDKEGAGVMDFSTFVEGGVCISGSKGFFEFGGWQPMFSDELPVNARDVSAAID